MSKTEVITILLIIGITLGVWMMLPDSNPAEAEMTPTTVPTHTPTQKPTPTPTPTRPPTPTKEPTPSPVPSITKPVEAGHAFKPYTGYWVYNARGTAQWRLQQICETDETTGIRVAKDRFGEWRYCVALGGYWCGYHPEHIGRCFDVVMLNGAVLKCVLADVKRQEDTKKNANRYGRTNNDVLEFIVQEKMFPASMKGYGDCSRISEEFQGDVKELIVYDMWIDGFWKEIEYDKSN